MGLLDEMAAAVEAEKERKQGYAAKNRERTLEITRRLAARTFGTPTGEQVKRFEGSGMEDEYALPEGAVIYPGRFVIDGVKFGLKHDRNGTTQYAAPVLTCPECGEEHLGAILYKTKDYVANVDRIGDSMLATLAQELEKQRAGDHKCYATSTYAVVSAARSAAHGLRGTSPRDLLSRADAYLTSKGEW